jgi:hypothetical protein
VNIRNHDHPDFQIVNTPAGFRIDDSIGNCINQVFFHANNVICQTSADTCAVGAGGGGGGGAGFVKTEGN